MYRVIKMYGDSEPWWFLDGWEEDIVSSTASLCCSVGNG